MRKIFAGLLAAIVLSVSAAHVFASDIVETAASAGNVKTFVAAVDAAGFAASLESGPYTVFAPSDEAFAKLPDGTWAALVKDKAKLAQVLGHHVVPGKIMAAEVKPGKIKTIQGELLTLTSDNGKITVDEASVIESDVNADNGVIHVIDAVLLPE